MVCMSEEVEENAVNVEKPEEIVTFTCPKCGGEFDHVVRYGKSNFNFCPGCGATLSQRQLPEGIRIVRKPKKTEEKPRTEMPGEEEGISLFERPKSPHQILKEVLEEYGVNPRFIEMVVKRSRNTGGIHPSDLQYLLRHMRISGVKDDETAAWIAADYGDRLKAEQEKARRTGERIFYPLTRPTITSPPPRFDYGDYGYGRGYPEYGRPREPWETPEMYRMRRYREAFAGQALTKEDVAEIVKGILEEERKREEEKKIWEALQKQKEYVDSKFEELKNLLIQQSQSASPPDVATKEDIIKAIREKDTSDYIKYLEARQKDLMEQLKEERRFWKERLEELREKLEKPQVVYKPGEYSDDTLKFAAEGLHRLADIVERRQPLRVVIDGIPKLLYPPVQEKPKLEETKESKTGIFEFLEKEFVEKE